MTTFTINNENEIVAFATPEEAAAETTTPFDTFASQKELAELAAAWPAERLVAIWNSLPGVDAGEEVQELRRRPSAGSGSASRAWARPPSPQRNRRSRRPNTKAKGGAQAAKGAPAKGKATKKATPAKNAPKAKKAAKAREAAGPREGSKTAQVVAMLQRKNGATPGRDHGEDGLAAAHRPRLHGRRDEEGRLHRRVLQAGGRGADVSHQQVTSTRLPSRPPGSGRGGLSCFWRPSFAFWFSQYREPKPDALKWANCCATSSHSRSGLVSRFPIGSAIMKVL